MYQLKIDVSSAAAGIRGMLKRGKTITNAMKRVSRLWKEKIQVGFDQQRDPYGNKWEPLKDSTLRLRKARGFSGAEILRETGDMAESLEVSASTKEVILSMDDPSQIHQYGNPNNRMFGKGIAPIAERKIFPVRDGEASLPADWSDEALAILATYVKDGE